MADTEHQQHRASQPAQYPPELKQRAIRMVLDSFDRGEQRLGLVTRIARSSASVPSRCAAGSCRPRSTGGRRAGTTSEEAQRISRARAGEPRAAAGQRDPEESASAFFAAELDRPANDDPVHR